MRTIAILCACLLAQRALADLGAVGPEFQVNTYTTTNQLLPRVGADASGNFVVVWDSGSYYRAGPDGSRAAVSARRFDAAGSPQGPEFVVNTYTPGLQGYSRVGIAPGGEFIVSWQSGDYPPFEQDGSLAGAFVQRFAPDGARLGGEQRANTTTAGFQGSPAVAVGPAGDAMVVWAGFEFSPSAPGDGDSGGVFAQRYDASGAPAGTEFQVNTYTTGLQRAPAVAAVQSGGFVVVWESGSSYYQTGQDGSRVGVFGQRLDASGDPVGDEFQVNTYTTDVQSAPEVAAQPDGGFVVVWQSSPGFYGSGGQDGSSAGVFGQRFDATGARAGGEFQVNTYTTGPQDAPDVAADEDGNLVVTWRSAGFGGATQDGSEAGIFARHLTGDGAPVGPEFQVNTYTTGGQRSPSVTRTGAGDFVLVWTSGYTYGQTQDGDGAGVFGQRLRVSAFEPARPVAATKLALRDAPANARARRLSLRSEDPALAVGTTSRDDPTLGGGRLRLRSAAFDATYELPAGFWRSLGAKGGWSYRDAGMVAGPITKIVLRHGKLRLSGKGAGLVLDLTTNPDPVEVQLQIGATGLRQCVRLGGTTAFKPGRRFRAAGAAAPPSCGS